MPSLESILLVAESLEKSPIIVVPDRCVAVRNRNASCRACVDVCPVDAIEVALNQVELSASACIACGACAAACPTEALVPTEPTDGALAARAAASMRENGGRAAIACARIASKNLADHERFAEVPCLARMSEVLALELAAQGATEVLLVDGDCSTCKHRACVPIMEDAVQRSNDLLFAQGSEVRVSRVTGFPDELRADSESLQVGASRRGFLSDAVGMAKDTAAFAARTTIEKELGYKLDERSIGERLRVQENGTLPLLRMKRHEAAINALDAIGQPQVDALDTRLFGSIEVNVGKCNKCSMCAVFCPTGALSRDPFDRPSKPLCYLEFSASDCVRCGLCADVCWKGALKISPTVPTDELFDFEPRSFILRRS